MLCAEHSSLTENLFSCPLNTLTVREGGEGPQKGGGRETKEGAREGGEEGIKPCLQYLAAKRALVVKCGELLTRHDGQRVAQIGDLAPSHEVKVEALIAKQRYGHHIEEQQELHKRYVFEENTTPNT